MSAGRWQFFIDCGGTFTDCIGVSPRGAISTTKVLSGADAPVRAIEALLARSRASEWEGGTSSTLSASVRLGTTVATNALLERRGVPTLLVAPKGLAGVFDIGTQERPALFALEIEKPSRLHAYVLEVAGRIGPAGERIEALDLAGAREGLAAARAAGARSVAVVRMHACVDAGEEQALAALARELGFEDVVCSHETVREIGLLARGETTIADAYLTPRLREQGTLLQQALPRAELRFMQSSGGLTGAARFRAPNALVSGPAGGVLATRALARRAGRPRAIGFDMGGTSTDVSIVDEAPLERSFESVVGGVRVKAPMLRIHTVAAGGGSLCRFDGSRLLVGPESAGADPGPLCYALRDASGALCARELTVTDANFILGRLLPDRFPFPIERAPVDRALGELRDALARAGFERSPEQIAAGFIEIANAAMAQAIVEVCVARGVDPRDHVLVGFGGAGGQHVCALAARLGLREILLHPFAGLFSAFGIGLAQRTWHGERDGGGRQLAERGPLAASVLADWAELEQLGREALVEEGEPGAAIVAETGLALRYAGTDTALEVEAPPEADWRAAFEALHRDRFGYVRPGRAIEIHAVRLRVAGSENTFAARTGESVDPATIAGAASAQAPPPLRTERIWFPGPGFVEAPVHAREALRPGHRLAGPALILEANATVVVDPGFALEVDAESVLHLKAQDAADALGGSGTSPARPMAGLAPGRRRMRASTTTIRCASRSWAAASCRSRSRWARCSGILRSRPTSRSGSTTPVRSSTATAGASRTRRTARSISARWRIRSRLGARALRPSRPATRSSPTIPSRADRTCPTSPS